MSTDNTQALPELSAVVDEREAFEYWASDSGQWPKAVARSGEVYHLMATQSYWLAWQARAALEAQKAQEPLGYMNAGYLHEMQQGRMPYAHVYLTEEVGAHVPVYAAHPPAAPALPSNDASVKANMREAMNAIADKTAAPSPATDIDEAAIARMTENGAKAWEGHVTAPALVPLTGKQVKELAASVGYDDASAQERADFINGLRHGERAHGIGLTAGTASKDGV